MEKKLYRSRSDRMIAGVCGGLGEYLEVDPVWIRLFFVVLLFATGFGFWAYLVLWIIIPDEKRVGLAPGDTVQANVQEMADRARELGQSLQRSFQNSREAATEGEAETSSSGAAVVGAAFIILGTFLLLREVGILAWFDWSLMWPLLLILIGSAMLVTRLRG